MVLRNVVDEFHDDDGLAYTGTAEQPDLAALQERLDEVNDFHAGLKHLRGSGLLFKSRSQAVDGHALVVFHGAKFVHRLADDVHHAAEGTVANGNGYGAAEVSDLHAADHAVRGLHGDATHAAFA